MVQTPQAQACTPSWLDHLRVTRIEAELEPEAPWTLPAEPETLLRGVLGSAVFELLCVRPHRRCTACDLRLRCEIPSWYDPGRVGADQPRPLLPRTSLGPGEGVGPGRPWRASWLALGEIPRSSVLVEAIVRLGRLGLGEARVPHRLARLSVQGAGPAVPVIVEDRETGAGWPAPGALRAFVQLPADPAGLELRVVRPTRWKGADRRRAPTIGDLVRAALGRVRQVAREQGRSLDAWWDDPCDLDQPWATAHWVQSTRQNSRGDQHRLSGWVGTLRCGPEIAPWADLLAAAEVLALGQHLSFGLGQIELDWR